MVVPGAGLQLYNCHWLHRSLGLNCPYRKGFPWIRHCPCLVTDSERRWSHWEPGASPLQAWCWGPRQEPHAHLHYS